MTSPQAMKRLTHCTVPGHGTRCEAAQGRDSRYERCTERRRAFAYEQAASR